MFCSSFPFCVRTEDRTNARRTDVSNDDVIMTSDKGSVNRDLKRPLTKFDLNTTQNRIEVNRR